MVTRKYTGYMNTVTTSLQTMGPCQRILDIPAGHGQFVEELRQFGHEVVPADVHKNKPDYVCANMNFPLPFQTDEFDVVTCLEGIEHVFNPINLLAELIRVTRPTGRVYLSTPNIMNYYSRLQYLLTGTFFGFCPAEIPDPDIQDLEGDLGHISPFRILKLDTLRSTTVLTSMTFSVIATNVKSYSPSMQPSICLVGRGHGFSSTQAGPKSGANAIKKSTGASTALLFFSVDP